jgi:dephospho-CoA kinase
MPRPAPLRIGLTGGIGSGKSTVARLMGQLGSTIIDTDAIARALTQAGGLAIPAITAEFGSESIDESGALDRTRMRQRAFADPSVRKRLEGILHPLIRDETSRLAASVDTGAVVFDVPLLVESGRWREQVDKVIVVDCSETTQVGRVMARSSWTADSVHAVIAQQADRVLRRRAADAVLFNDGITQMELARAVRSLWGCWCERL